jgi:hypothetical protein
MSPVFSAISIVNISKVIVSKVIKSTVVCPQNCETVSLYKSTSMIVFKNNLFIRTATISCNS